METKLFELRDEGTFIPIIATLMLSGNQQESYLLGRAGYSPRHALVLLTDLEGHREPKYDPNRWGGRTFQVAHRYIMQNWFSLESGAVVDVEYILGERPAPKASERVSNLDLSTLDVE